MRTVHRAIVVVIATIAMLASAPAASAAQSASWGWTTDTTFVMSFFGGIPYRGCERATLTVPNSGSSGPIDSSTSTTIVVGLANCSWSTIPSSLNPNTIKTRTRVLRNGAIVSGCDSAMVYNAAGQGLIAAASPAGCEKDSTQDAEWRVAGYYGWWDYDDGVWRSETVGLPVIND